MNWKHLQNKHKKFQVTSACLFVCYGSPAEVWGLGPTCLTWCSLSGCDDKRNVKVMKVNNRFCVTKSKSLCNETITLYSSNQLIDNLLCLININRNIFQNLLMNVKITRLPHSGGHLVISRLRRNRRCRCLLKFL